MEPIRGRNDLIFYILHCIFSGAASRIFLNISFDFTPLKMTEDHGNDKGNNGGEIR
jgi:hypothetical protein